MTQRESNSDPKDISDSSLPQFVVSKKELFDGTSHLFRGSEHGGVPLTIFWDQYSPGLGPKLHKHPYEEVHLVEEGRVIFTVDSREIGVEGGNIVIVPRNTPHKFMANSDDKMLKMISIHCSEKIITEYLE
jgi:quercetin dioxygenase-like cupin family protein